MIAHTIVVGMLVFAFSTWSSLAWECHTPADYPDTAGSCNAFVEERKCDLFDMKPVTNNDTHLHFGYISPLSTSEAEWGNAQVFSILCAMQHINEDDSILPGVHVDLVFADSKGTQNKGFRSALCLKEAGVPVIVGPAYSSAAFGATEVSSIYNIPIVGTTPSNPELSRKDPELGFPTFSRVFPSDSFQGRALVHLIRRFGWRSVSTVHHRGNAYHEGIMDSFRNEAVKDSNLDIRTGHSFYGEFSGDEAQVQMLEEIKASGSRIIVVVLYISAVKPFLEKAHELGMTGDGWVYISPESWIAETSQLAPEIGTGVIGLQPVPGRGTPEIAKLESCWASHVNDTDGMFGNFSWVPDTMTNFAPFMYDAVQLAARSIHKIGVANVNNGTALLDAIRNTPFAGASGYVQLDSVTGDRASVNYAIINTRKAGGSLQIGVVDTSDMSIEFEVDEDTIQFGGDGSTTVPLDVVYDCSPNPENYVVSVNPECRGPFQEVTFEARSVQCQPLTSFNISCDYPVIDMRAGGGGFVAGAVSIAFSFVSLFVLLAFWEQSVIKRGQPRFLLAMVFGCILAQLPALASVNNPPTERLCSMSQVMLTLGLTLLFGPLMLKTYRVSQMLLNHRQREVISDSKLFVYLLLLLGAVLLINVLVLTLTPIKADTSLEPLNNIKSFDTPTEPFWALFSVERRQCSMESDSLVNLFVFFFAVLIAVLCYWSFFIRNVQSDISESKYIFLGSYNSALATAVAFGLSTGIKTNYVEKYTITSLCTMWGTSGILALLLIPKFFMVYQKVVPSSTRGPSPVVRNDVSATMATKRDSATTNYTECVTNIDTVAEDYTSVAMPT